jgi:hypothetical protein
MSVSTSFILQRTQGDYSDGDASKHPTISEPPNSLPETYEYFRAVGPNEPAGLTWRLKLASGLVRAIGPDFYREDFEYQLQALPSRYVLVEHIKVNEVNSIGAGNCQ